MRNKSPNSFAADLVMKMPILLAVVLAAAAQVHADIITSSNYLEVDVQGPESGAIYTTPSVPLNVTKNETINDSPPYFSATSSSTYNFLNTGFSVGLNQNIGPGSNFLAGEVVAESLGKVFFNVTVPTSYTGSGDYNVNGNAQAPLLDYLEDFTTGIILYESDSAHGNSGSLIGTLVVGDQYLWDYDALLTVNLVQPGSAAATATGNFTLNFSTVPEPISLGLVAIGGLTLLARRRRRS